MLLKQMRAYLELMRLHRPIGIWLLLWPTYWALFLAGQGQPRLDLIVVFGLGVLLMRSAGCVINDYADRRFDGQVARTRSRPLVSGRVSPKAALWLFAALIVLAANLLWFLNRESIAWALLALVLAISYPFFKRFTHLPQAWLGLAFSAGIPMAFAAQTGVVPNLAGWLLAANVCWVLAYDTAYAMADRDDDVKIGVKSTAILFGRHDRLMIGLLHASSLLLLIQVGRLTALGPAYFVALTLAAGLALYQQWLIKDRQPDHCISAFRNNHWWGLLVLLGILAGSH